MQIPFRAIPGGVQVDLGDSFITLRIEDDRPTPPAFNHARQGALPLCGVLPGARWRRDHRDETGKLAKGRPDLTTKQLLLALEGQYKHRGRRWTKEDTLTKNEQTARSWDALDVRQRYSTPAPAWLGATTVPRRLEKMLTIVWNAYKTGAFGVRMSGVQWAARLGVSPRSVRNYRKEAQQLGLLTVAIGLRRSRTCQDGSEQDMSLYQVGPALLVLAGQTAYDEPGSPPPPRRSGLTRTAARTAAGALRQASRHREWAREGRHWEASIGLKRSQQPTVPPPPGAAKSSNHTPTPRGGWRTPRGAAPPAPPKGEGSSIPATPRPKAAAQPEGPVMATHTEARALAAGRIRGPFGEVVQRERKQEAPRKQAPSGETGGQQTGAELVAGYERAYARQREEISPELRALLDAVSVP